ncbi:MAG TPA: MMPL family transporter [Candidatus Limnocylindrales bacterium]|jgi:RND superfamily putative drug exporter|nr:MMPL family transporter [Candidatus Limnocylindrales bacterium]
MSASPPIGRPPWTVRVASWSARHRWPVVAAWFALTIGLFAASLAMGGTRSEDAIGDEDEGSRRESAEAWVVYGAAGRVEPSAQLLLVVATPSGRMDDPANAAAVAAMVDRLATLTVTVPGASGPVGAFREVVNPLLAPPALGLVSPDGSTIRIVARAFGEGAEIEAKLAPIPALADELRAANPALEIHALNGMLANDEIGELVNSDLDGSLRLTIPLTFVILLVAFGAVVAALVPLVLAMTALLAAFGILGIYSQVVAPVSPYAGQLVVLIGLAVAVDYSLFMLTRYRTERRRYGANPPRPRIGLGRGWLIERGNVPDKLRAIETASSTAGRAVFFSGLAVMISIAGLFMLDDPLFRSMAIGTIAVVFISVVGSLTFLPATLAILGNGIDGGRVPFLGRDRGEGSGAWGRVVRAVMRRPVVSAVVTAALLLAMAWPVTRLHIGQSDFSSFPDSLESVQAVNLMEREWPQGSTLELFVVVTRADQDATQAAIERFKNDVLAIAGVSEPVESRLSPDGTVGLVSFTLAGSSNDYANWDIVREVRSRAAPAAFGPVPGVAAYVTGSAASSLDITSFYADGMPLVFAFVLGLSFLLLLVAFHSIVIPIKAIILNLLSTGAAYGLLVLVFQEGWLAGVLGFKPGVIEAFVPIFIFTILFGLSMDYHVFILTRVKEARDRGMGSAEAVARGISITAGTVTSAAAIMIVVFAVFVTLQLVVVRQLGFGLAVAILLDATIVRSILLPATMRLLGEWNWWMPRWLSWLPKVTIEGPVRAR